MKPKRPTAAVKPVTATSFSFDHYVTAIAVNWQVQGADPLALPLIGIALGDGSVKLLQRFNSNLWHNQTVRIVAAEAGGSVLCLAPISDGFVAGADDGSLSFITAAGVVKRLVRHPRSWIETVAVQSDGTIAYGYGKSVGIGIGGSEMTLGPLPSTVADLLWIGEQLAVAHFGGVTIFDFRSMTEDDLPRSRLLKWPGSHLKLALSPDGLYLASGLRDGEIHVWRTADFSDLRMAGYPGKVASIAWSWDSLYLAGSGIPELLGWGFSGTGPEGKEPALLWSPPAAAAASRKAQPNQPSQPPRITRLASSRRGYGWAMGLEDGQVLLRSVASPTVKYTAESAVLGAAVSALEWYDSPLPGEPALIVAGSENGKVSVIKIRNNSLDK